MKRVACIILAAAFLSIVAASASICDNAPCEKAINVTVGENFTISQQSYAGTGFEWWIQFDPAYLGLVNSSEKAIDSGSGMVGYPKENVFAFNTKKSGNTDVIMLLLRPWENGTIEERNIFPVNIT
jgi:predicted secreted protein